MLQKNKHTTKTPHKTTNDARAIIHHLSLSPSPTSRLMPTLSLSNGYFQKYSLTCTHTVLFLRTISYNMGYPFGQLGSVLCRHCSAIVKTLVCYQHTFVHESKPRHLMGCYEGTSSQPDSLHCTNIFKRYFRFSCSYFEVQRWMRPPL